MATDSRERTPISIRWQTKESLDSIKHPGQSYDGLFQELIRLWKRERGVEETDQAPSDVKREDEAND